MMIRGTLRDTLPASPPGFALDPAKACALAGSRLVALGLRVAPSRAHAGPGGAPGGVGDGPTAPTRSARGPIRQAARGTINYTFNSPVKTANAVDATPAVQWPCCAPHPPLKPCYRLARGAHGPAAPEPGAPAAPAAAGGFAAATPRPRCTPSPGALLPPPRRRLERRPPSRSPPPRSPQTQAFCFG